jgi:hypothetical protein
MYGVVEMLKEEGAGWLEKSRFMHGTRDLLGIPGASGFPGPRAITRVRRD